MNKTASLPLFTAARRTQFHEFVHFDAVFAIHLRQRENKLRVGKAE